VREAGYRITGHELLPIANDETAGDVFDVLGDEARVARHRTALVRYGFSAPIQALSQYGLIHVTVNVFDYGCGRGDDVRGLAANGIAVWGWDPHYAPEERKREADVVNLGFVINVIEDFEERATALRSAFSLARGVLASRRCSELKTPQPVDPTATDSLPVAIPSRSTTARPSLVGSLPMYWVKSRSQ
jgi:hypothetical protein